MFRRGNAVRRHRTAKGWAFAACVLAASPSVASDVQIRVRDCRSNVDLIARDARLSDVFGRLAKALDFQLHMEGVPDRLVALSMSAPAPELVAVLAAEHGSFMIRHTTDARCQGRQRVAIVWLTPKSAKPVAPGAVAANVSPVATGSAKPRTVVPVTETATRERLRQVEEDARRRKEAYEIHVRRYGKPPPPEPEEAATP